MATIFWNNDIQIRSINSCCLFKETVCGGYGNVLWRSMIDWGPSCRALKPMSTFEPRSCLPRAPPSWWCLAGMLRYFFSGGIWDSSVGHLWLEHSFAALPNLAQTTRTLPPNLLFLSSLFEVRLMLLSDGPLAFLGHILLSLTDKISKILTCLIPFWCPLLWELGLTHSFQTGFAGSKKPAGKETTAAKHFLHSCSQSILWPNFCRDKWLLSKHSYARLLPLLLSLKWTKN